MFNLQIDSVVEKYDRDGESCFGEVMEKLSAEITNRGRVITEIRLNGQPLTGGRQVDYYRYPLEQVQTLELTTTDPKSLAGEALDSAEEHIGMVKKSALRSAELFRLGDHLEANESYSKLVEGLRWMVKAISALTGMMQIDQTEISAGDNNLKEYQEKMLIGIFDLMYDAQKNEDWVGLADILEYELAPALDQWDDISRQLRSSVRDSYYEPI